MRLRNLLGAAGHVDALGNGEVGALEVRRAQDTLALRVRLALRLRGALEWCHLGAVAVSLHESLVLGLLHALAALLRRHLLLLLAAAHFEIVICLLLLRHALHLMQLLHLSRRQFNVVAVVVGDREVVIARMIVVDVDVGPVHLELERIVIVDDDDLARLRLTVLRDGRGVVLRLATEQLDLV